MARDNDILVAAPIEAAQHFLLSEVGWDAYEAILNAVGERSNYRMTYDEGVLELMSTSQRHEKIKYLIGCLIDAMLEAADIHSMPSGSFTMKRPDLHKGLEADQCYYIRSYRKVRDKDEVDLNVDPPPDLCVEIDVSNRSIDRLAVYAALGISEVWRWENHAIIVYTRQVDGHYLSGSVSREIVIGYEPSGLCRYLDFGLRKGHLAMIKKFRRDFRKWLGSRKKS